MKWIKEDDQKPPFNERVLAWNTCEGCRDKKPHTHNLLAKGFPDHGPFIATYHEPDMTLVNYYRSKGDHSWDNFAEPHWSPVKPTHWAYIESPYAKKTDSEKVDTPADQ